MRFLITLLFTLQIVFQSTMVAASVSSDATQCRGLWAKLQSRLPRVPLPKEEAARRLKNFLEDPTQGFQKYLDDPSLKKTNAIDHSDPLSEMRLSSEHEAQLREDIKEVIGLMGDLKQIDPKKFETWLEANWQTLATQPMIRAYAQEGKKLPIFIYEAYFRHLLHQGLKADDKHQVLDAAIQVIQNPYLRLFSGKTVKLAFTILGMAWTTIYFSTLPGTFGRIIGSVTNNMVGPIAEKAEQWSNLHMTGPATWIRQSLEGTSNEDLQEKNENLEKAADETKKKLQAFSDDLNLYDFKLMKPDQAKRNLEKLKNQWIDFGQFWSKTFPPYVREGRRISVEYGLDLPVHFAAAFSTHDSNGELHRQGLEQLFNRLQLQGIKREDLNQLKKEAQKVVEAYPEGTPPDSLEKAMVLNLNDALEPQVQRLRGLGMTESDMDEMFRHLAQIEKSDDAIAGVAASILFSDFIYPENYRLYPAEEKKFFDAIRDRYGYAYYMERVAKKISKTIQQMGFEVDYRLAEEQLKIMGTAIERKTGNNPSRELNLSEVVKK